MTPIRKKRTVRRVQVGPWSIRPWSKTVWANILSALVAFLALPELQSFGIDPRDLLLAQAALNLALRFVSKEPIVERRSRR